MLKLQTVIYILENEFFQVFIMLIPMIVNYLFIMPSLWIWIMGISTVVKNKTDAPTNHLLSDFKFTFYSNLINIHTSTFHWFILKWEAESLMRNWGKSKRRNTSLYPLSPPHDSAEYLLCCQHHSSIWDKVLGSVDRSIDPKMPTREGFSLLIHSCNKAFFHKVFIKDLMKFIVNKRFGSNLAFRSL